MIDGARCACPHRGLGRALDLILTGREVQADEALRIGLADRVVPGQALAAALELGSADRGFPPAAMLADRASVYRGSI